MTIGLARVYGYSISRVPTTLCSTEHSEKNAPKRDVRLADSHLLARPAGIDGPPSASGEEMRFDAGCHRMKRGGLARRNAARSDLRVSQHIASGGGSPVQLQEGREPSPPFGVPIPPGGSARSFSATKGSKDVRQGALAGTKGINRTAGRNHASFSSGHNRLSRCRWRLFGRWGTRRRLHSPSYRKVVRTALQREVASSTVAGLQCVSPCVKTGRLLLRPVVHDRLRMSLQAMP